MLSRRNNKINKHHEKWPKRAGIALLALLLFAGLALLWGFCIEPSLLTVTNLEITDGRLPAELDGTRVVFFADLHVGSWYTEADAERALKKIGELKPDLLLFGGDITQHEPERNIDADRVAKAFAAIEPRWGKYAVYGNHDLEAPDAKAHARTMLEGGGFKILENEQIKAADGFYVAGTKPWPMHEEKWSQGEDGPAWAAENRCFTILLAHEPLQIEHNAQYPFALQLSGHTHGGQVALPFIGPLAKTYGTGKYNAGLFQVNDTKLYVTRGVGVIDKHVRFFSPPEIVVITLYKRGAS